GGDHAEVRPAVEGPDVLVVVVALEEHDRPPASAPELPVDLAGKLVDLLLERTVARDPAPAGGRDLDEGQASHVFRVLAEESPNRREPLRKALRVIDALDPEPQPLNVDPDLIER